MTENQSEEAERSEGITSALPSADRRSMLQGMAILGLGGGAIGSTAAQEGGGDDEGDDSGGGDDGSDGDSSGVKTAIQLYTLRNLPDTVPQLIRRVGAVDNNGGPGYDAVETAGLGDGGTSEVADALEQTGLSGASAHVGLEPLENDLEGTVETYSQVGIDTFVVPYVDPSAIDTVEKVEGLAERMNDVSDQLSDVNEDARLGYHNHDGEFQLLEDDRTPLEVFDETLNDDVIFEIDVGWVLTAGYDPVEVIQQYSDRTQLIHMKDMADGEFAEIGEGNVDMRAVAQTAREEADVDYLIYEHDEPSNPAGSVATGAGVLSFLDGKPGLECLEFEDVGAPDYSGELSGDEQC